MFIENMPHVLHALFYSNGLSEVTTCKNRSMSSKNSPGRSRLAKWPPWVSNKYFSVHISNLQRQLTLEWALKNARLGYIS
jgi:hypothetical protein